MTDKETYAIIDSRGLCIAFQPYNPMDKIKQLEQENAELKAENERLKQEWRLDCLKCEYKNTKADVDKYRQTLQEIKEIAKECTTCGDCSNCKYREDCDTDFVAQALGVCRMILDLITKAESEV